MHKVDTDQVWLTILGPDEAETYDDVARVAGVEPLGKAWQDISRSEARSILISLLHRHLAYRSVELMPVQRARWLADEFINAFGEHGGRFATNGGLNEWNPATDYTFDRGLVLITDHGAGLFWVAAED